MPTRSPSPSRPRVSTSPASAGEVRSAEVADLLRRAREHLRGGRSAHAEALAEVALAWDPGCDEAMEMLARLAADRQDHARAAALLTAAIARQETAPRQLERGRQLVALGRQAEAVPAFRRATELAPEDGAMANDLGVALAQTGQVAEAEAAFRRAVALLPQMAEARGNLATALHQLGRPLDAAAQPLPVTAQPDDGDPVTAQSRLADAMLRERRFAEAVDASTRAGALCPGDAEQWRLHAERLQLAGRLPEAETAARQALELGPDLPAAHATLGWVLRRQERMTEALDLLHTAARRWPDDAVVLNALAVTVMNSGQPAEALDLMERAVALAPADAEPQHNRATLLLRLGQFRAGWEAYEWRWRTTQGQAVYRNLPQPLWTGEPLEGRTILLHAEQGLGDTLQFMRYAGLVAERGSRVRRNGQGIADGHAAPDGRAGADGRVVLEVPGPLVRLAASLPNIVEVVCAGDKLPAFDLHCPLLSLPRAFGTLPETIPRPPYLAVDPAHVAVWQERLGQASGLRIGLVWAGNTEHRDDYRRSLPFTALAPFWDLPGVRWFSLQVGPRAAELAAAPAGAVTDIAPLLGDFADTAAALSALDLFVCVNSAPVHLAGALGRPAWLLLPYAADWRWMTDPAATPWYPSVRLFRQAATGAWGDVVARVAAALERGREKQAGTG